MKKMLNKVILHAIENDVDKLTDERKTYSFAAFLVKGNKILSKGVNRPSKTHPEQYKAAIHSCNHKQDGYFVKTIHAELDALRQVDNAEGCTLYVARDRKAPSHPCKVCMQIIKKRRVKSIVYFDRDMHYTKKQLR